MPEIFINYRGDGNGGKGRATLLNVHLRDRFGPEHVFFDNRSIRAGSHFPTDLLTGVRRCSLLLAVMEPGWEENPALGRPDDWVTREIVEAYGNAVRIVPIRTGRTPVPLRARDLPPALSFLADLQFLPLDDGNHEADLERIGDTAVELVPALEKSDRLAADSRERRGEVPPTVTNTVGDVSGTAVQTRDVTGDAGTVVKGSSGPVHTGSGNLYQNSRHDSGDRHFHGDVMGYVEGDNHDGFHQHFGESRRRRDGDEERRRDGNR
ncbi:hypothetical protein GCM10027160_44190 [Streptomyces calidiresistens]|uniref:TIR domain-containing protein n=1 Tax=Streptomyces calidiresistens TaxID=1485586 RepID=A0A7W3XX87_9ACTN|nr:TIR domain-containing protein [Streptomyces calidiresistens]MBB0230542.1 TIR domain-containing protein [Streptomyces calidiresistens]